MAAASGPLNVRYNDIRVTHTMVRRRVHLGGRRLRPLVEGEPVSGDRADGFVKEVEGGGFQKIGIAAQLVSQLNVARVIRGAEYDDNKGGELWL